MGQINTHILAGARLEELWLRQKVLHKPPGTCGHKPSSLCEHPRHPHISPLKAQQTNTQTSPQPRAHSATHAACSLGRCIAIAACSAAACRAEKLMAQLSGTEGSSTPNTPAAAAQLPVAAASSLVGGCHPCLNALHQVASAGSCCCGRVQLLAATAAAAVAATVGFRPRCCASTLAKMLPPLLANRTEFAVAGLKESL